MDNSLLLSKQREAWLTKRSTLVDKDVSFIAGKDTLKGKLLDLFSASYFKREKLIRSSEVLYGYVFKDYRPQFDAEFYFPTWVLHSPVEEVNTNPSILEKAARNLSTYTPVKRKKDPLYDALHDNLYQTTFLEIPKEYSEGKLVYLSIVYFRHSNMPELKFGLNFFLANRSISKELLYLPSQFWIAEWGAYYRNETKE